MAWAGKKEQGASRAPKKKRAGRKPCSKIVSTLFPRKIGFDLD
jgi:hypothetical protein